MPRDFHDSPDFDSLRQAVQAAASKVGYPKLHLFCRMLGYPLDIGPDALKRYGEGGTGRINVRDAQRIAAFFHDTDIGRALAGEDALSIRMTEPLLRAFRTAAQSANGLCLNGPYAIHHGSFMYPDYYAKLAASFATFPMGAIWGDIRYWDNQAAEPGIRAAIANLIFRRSCVQMLSLNNDNAEGFELVVGVPSASSSGVVQEIVGTVQGMNLRGEPYHRAVLIRRLTHPWNSEQIRTATGVRKLDQWPRADQEIFRRLAQCRLRPPFDDPISGL